LYVSPLSRWDACNSQSIQKEFPKEKAKPFKAQKQSIAFTHTESSEFTKSEEKDFWEDIYNDMPIAAPKCRRNFPKVGPDSQINLFSLPG